MSSRSTNVSPDADGPRTEVVHPPSASGSTDAPSDLAGTLADEMAAAWRRGERPLAEEYLRRQPELWDNRDAAFRLICEEVCLRQEFALPVDPRDFLVRFPHWQGELLTLLDCHRLLQEEGDREQAALKDFELLAELGKGAQGQVHLAKQRSLGDRPVVLKITSCHGQEHLSLARLQHTHIVPLYGVLDNPVADQRVLCMPYFGNVTLTGLLAALQHKPFAERTGQDLLDVLDRAQKDVPVQLPGLGPARPFLARTSYAHAVSWIGACLADALQYAHDRGLVHLDIKPSNILLAGDGQPMLLDFHLAREPVQPHGPRPRGLGGTPTYMAPEQREVLQALVAGKPVTRVVDGRADQFSLGLVLYQALGGPVPSTGPRPHLRSCNAKVSTGLADIIHKCLADDPAARYPDAGALAADLRRHIGHQKLRGVRNRSLKERWHKWRQRQPLALWFVLLFAGLFAVVGGGGYLVWSASQTEGQERLERIRGALEAGRRHLERQDFAGAIATLNRGLELAGDSRGAEELTRQLGELLVRAKRRQAVHQLHALTDRLRYLPGGPYLSASALAEVDRSCRALWTERDRILRGQADGDDADRQQVRTDMLDVALLWTQVKDTSRAADRQEVLQVLSEAQKLVGAHPVLTWEIARTTDAAAAPPPPSTLKTAWEFYAVGRALLHARDVQKARPYLERAVRLDAASFWPNFYEGLCAYGEGRWQAAARAFAACVALSPRSAWAYYNRALALTKLREHDAALQDFTQALELDKSFAAAALNRALLYFELQRFADAHADVGRVLRIDPDYPGARQLLAKLPSK